MVLPLEWRRDERAMRETMTISSFALHARALIAASISAALGAGACLAAEPSESPWAKETYSQVRLVSGAVDDKGEAKQMAGIQIRLDPGWKTYWRTPGDSGVPPQFDWSGSKNLKQAEVLYPAPHRFADADGTAIGYTDEVVFPVKITPENPGEPVELKLSVGYGLCKTLCIPNEASLSLAMPTGSAPGEDLLLQRFTELVPTPTENGALPAVRAVEAKLDGDKPELVVDAEFPKNASGTDLFIEAGSDFVPVPKPLGPLQDGKQSFIVSFGSPEEAAAIKGKTLTATLVWDGGGREASFTAK